jgi:hypothetical protein
MRKIARTFAMAALLSLSAASTAFAARPTVIDLPPISFDDPYLCGGDPVLHVEYGGTFKLTLFYDNDGNLIRDAIVGGGRITVTFSANGKSLSGASPAPFRTAYNADGSIATLTANGLNASITVPGEGVVLLDTGTIVWEGGFLGPLDFAAGPHEWFVGGDLSAFCAYFA